ncbi:AAA family ATPase [Succinivibrio sp.]|uniref:ATP-binding protein n=1 Tax=Succinivibrio sp. TaxID=2053619 RepID=UPI0025DC7A0A|nr:AAA family ATPase [Succinivibrio sp.]MBQ9219522.1 ATP-binding protein [Succinivibrio sp.]
MQRFAMQKLVEWKNKKNKKPLVIMGARQVGKTWLMKEFGKQYYDKVAYISFYNNARMRRVFEQDYDIKRIISAINIEVGFTVSADNTLIIFDEIQNAPKAFESLKYFNEDAPEYNIIVAGSLLGVALHEGVSYPVGKVTTLNLYPLNFREFLYAVGENVLADALKTKDYNLIDSFSEKYIYHLKNYMYVGGMPEAVNCFLNNSDYYAARDVQKEIILQYRGDFGKHISSIELPRINMVWDSVPMQLAKENKKFFFGQIKKGARSSEFEKAIQWLIDSGLIYRVHKVNIPHVPLSAYKELSFFKLFFLDIGLLGAMSELDLHSIIEGSRLFIEFKGAFTEQYVLQQIVSDTEYSPYYYGTESATFKQDFLIQKGMNAVPIEVKAETNIHSQSLKAFYNKFHPEQSIRLSLLNYQEQDWMVNIPLYAVCNL